MQPELEPGQVEALVGSLYGEKGSARPLTGERDANFHFLAGSGEQYVFKASCAEREGDPIDLPDDLLLHLERADPRLPVPRVRRAANGASRVALRDALGRRTEALLCSYIEGEPLMSSRRCAPQRTQCGQWLARIAQALRGYAHPSCHRPVVWDVRRFADVPPELARLQGVPGRPALERFAQDFLRDVAPALERMRRQVVHNDLNARNVIVDRDDPARIAGIIDFGDAVHTALVADVAVGAVGQLAVPEDCYEAMGQFVAAYLSVEALHDDELAILAWLVAARLVTNFVIVSRAREQAPDDAHFSGFGLEYFGWRIDLALRLAADPRGLLRCL